MMNLPTHLPDEEEGETLAQRVRRLKEASGGTIGLPSARPVSGDFTSELMSQFGGDLLDTNTKDKGKGKGKEKEISPSPGPEEEETLGQRRKRLQAERSARAKEVGTQGPPPEYSETPQINKRRSMADILQAHPAAGADRVTTYQKPPSGLLGLHEKKSSQRASTMMDFPPTAAAEFIKSHPPNRQSSGAFKAGLYNDGKGGIIPPPQQIQPQAQVQPNFAFPQPYHGFNTFQTPYGSNMNLAANGNSTYNIGTYPPAPMQMSYMPAMPTMQGITGVQHGAGGAGMGMAGGMGMGMQGGVGGYGYGTPAMNMMQNMSMLQLQMGQQPLNQGQIDMVERWRQSVLQ